MMARKADIKILAVIAARGGSKGIPGKNIKKLIGKPLIAYTIQAAQNSRHRSRMDLICSTDDEKIARTARRYGCDVPFMRPKKLATDKAASADVVMHALHEMEERNGVTYSHILLLQPTSPLRTAWHIDEAVRIMTRKDADAVVSVAPVGQSPYIMRTVTAEGYLMPLLKAGTFARRQDMPDVYLINGAIYLVRRGFFVKTRQFSGKRACPYVMDSSSSIDIDTLEDWNMAERLLKKRVSS